MYSMHVRQDTVGESTKFDGRAIYQFLLVHAFYDLGVLHCASGDGVDHGQCCKMVEVDWHGSMYVLMNSWCTIALGCDMASGKTYECGCVLVDPHGCVAQLIIPFIIIMPIPTDER
jgi:hypothetical protein